MIRPEATDPADIFRDHLRTIRDLWGDMLPRLKSASVQSYGGGTRTSTAGDDDNGDHNRDVDRLTVVISARGDILARLNGWCRVIVEDWNVSKRTPDGMDVHSLCEFLDRWALAFSGHEAFEDALEEVAMSARQVERIARPQPRDSVWIGDCPVTIGCDGDRVECGTPIRVRTGEEIKCRGCGTDDTLDGWMLRIVGHHDLVTYEQLGILLRQRMGIQTTPVQLRQWVRRGVITVAEHRREGRSTVALFDRVQVFADLAYRRGA